MGYFFDAFTLVLIAGFGIAMFAGSGATINQYFGVPVQVGTIGLGIVAAVVVCFGLKSLIDFLGIVGIIIIVFSAFVGIYALGTADVPLMEAQANIETYVAEGKIFQAGILGIQHPIFSAINYAGVMLLTSCAFMVALGQQFSGKKEAIVGGIFSSVFYFFGVILIALTILYSLDYVANHGAQVPMLAVIEKILPALSGVFALILLLGILTTICGYLWIIASRFAEDKSLKSHLIVVISTGIGTLGGSIIPFNTIINIFYPFAGLVGMAIFCLIIVKEVQRKRENKA